MAVELGTLFEAFEKEAITHDDRHEIDRILSEASSLVRQDGDTLLLNSRGTETLNEFMTDQLRSMRDVLDTYVAFARWDTADNFEQRWGDDVHGNDVLTDADLIQPGLTPEQQFIYERLYEAMQERLAQHVGWHMDTTGQLLGGKTAMEVLNQRYGAEKEVSGARVQLYETDSDRVERLLLTYALENLGPEETREAWEWNRATVAVTLVSLAIAVAAAGVKRHEVQQINEAYPEAAHPASAMVEAQVLSRVLEEAPTAQPEQLSVQSINQSTLETEGRFTILTPDNQKLRVTVTEGFTNTVDIDNPNLKVLEGTVNGDPKARAIIVQDTEAGITAAYLEDSNGGAYSLKSVPEQSEDVVVVQKLEQQFNEGESDSELPDGPVQPRIQTQSVPAPVNTQLGVTSDRVVDLGYVPSHRLLQQMSMAEIDVQSTLATRLIAQAIKDAHGNGTVRKVCVVEPPASFTVDETTESIAAVRRQAVDNKEIDVIRTNICSADIVFMLTVDVPGQTASSYFTAKGSEKGGAMARYAYPAIPIGAILWSPPHEFGHTLGYDHQFDFMTVVNELLVNPNVRGAIFGKYGDAMAYLAAGQERSQVFSNANNPAVVNGVRIGDAEHDQIAWFNQMVLEVASWREPAKPFAAAEDPKHKVYVPLAGKNMRIGGN